jgi:hypothetical protein
MASDVVGASTHPDWPLVIAALERATLATAVDLKRFSSQALAHQGGALTASDLYVSEVAYQRARRLLRHAVRLATTFLRPRHTRWRAASLLCVAAARALDPDTVERNVIVAIQVDVTQWTLEEYDECTPVDW